MPGSPPLSSVDLLSFSHPEAPATFFVAGIRGGRVSTYICSTIWGGASVVPICGGGVAISTLAQIGGLVAPVARLVALVDAAVAFLIAFYAILIEYDTYQYV